MENKFTRRGVLGMSLGALAVPTLAQAANRPVLVELFTSQGCSSCPPADAILGQIKNRADVYAVSLNVDYWDYLGWRDTLAKPEYSKRQFDYGKSRGDMEVYTPQVVVNGRYHAVGSQRSAVEALIEKAQLTAPSVPMRLDISANEITIEVGSQPFDGEATLWLMAIAPEVEQKIERGENSGSTITYHNVVRNLVPAGMWKGEAITLRLMRDAVMANDCKSCIAVLQRGKTGPVLGLAR